MSRHNNMWGIFTVLFFSFVILFFQNCLKLMWFNLSGGLLDHRKAALNWKLYWENVLIKCVTISKILNQDWWELLFQTSGIFYRFLSINLDVLFLCSAHDICHLCADIKLISAPKYCTQQIQYVVGTSHTSYCLVLSWFWLQRFLVGPQHFLSPAGETLQMVPPPHCLHMHTQIDFIFTTSCSQEK